tara:strand:- start:2875 stop:3615 length:741 start_codon:yes stop_codon:yes gene_type:complete
MTSCLVGQEYDIDKIIQSKKTIFTYNLSIATIPANLYSQTVAYNTFEIERGFNKKVKLNISHTIIKTYESTLNENSEIDYNENSYGKSTNLGVTFKINKNIIASISSPINYTQFYTKNNEKEREDTNFNSVNTTVLLFKLSPPVALVTQISYRHFYNKYRTIKNGNEISINPTCSFSVNDKFSLILGAVLSNEKPTKLENQLINVEQNYIHLILGGQYDINEKLHTQFYFLKGNTNSLSFSTSYEI